MLCILVTDITIKRTNEKDHPNSIFFSLQHRYLRNGPNLTSGTTNWLRAVSFTTVDTGYVVGYGGIILKTSDGGLNWISQTSTTSNNLFGVFFISSSTGWACGASGTILKTTDGGATWTSQASSAVGTLHEPLFCGCEQWLYRRRIRNVFKND